MLLKGIRVVDFTWVVGGPIATQYLGLMGAEVIKVESATRPEYRKRSGWFPALNGSKLSCTLNLKEPEGQELVRELIRKSDVVVENFSTGVTEKLGIDYARLRPINPRLIMLSMSGLGREGQARDLLGYGSLLQAYSGWTSLVKETDLSVEGMGVRPPLTDHVAGVMGVLAILAALRRRDQSGHGALIDLSLLESIMTLLVEPLIEVSLTGESPPVVGNGSPHAAPHGCYACSGEDRWIALAIYDDDEWERLADLMGNPEWARSYRTGAERLANSELIDRTIAGWTRSWDCHQLAERLREIGIAAAASSSFHDLVADPHLLDRGYFTPQGDQTGTWVRGLPWIDSRMQRGHIRPAPGLGADNEYVFRQLLQLSDAQMDDLRFRGVLT
ncbi:CoA transferase [Paenibacillus validus]|uniref:CaiB/BaiF CoA transferase family protein n=1 Tax=Paenibacillus TaxID=44249 RepID=UPI0006D0D4AF|nr:MULTISPECIES: CoA transferase [Paenibacillus]MED4601889.1 CoA transferase [Paenibacillus validus]MED4606429.1 CoA transferase [Paenibacillus validus]